ncbi:hypothetical protein [Metallosphaera hakonensis]|uniref:hypothetical protein n=1 Tax=Metallosphaera hakonensis TaxID=79601 RepID=UPI002093D730|nr:hypothetical protein [Metallosphaera hakonensis]
MVVDTSPPVPPSQMPYPLWGPFLSVTTRFFDWAITPLSLGISFILSFLVALNVTLYISLFTLVKMKSTHRLAVSLGLLATSLSCSCELFTALIGATVSNIPFLVSISFMDTLGETLTVVAGVILTISSLVIASEITGTNPFSWVRWRHGIPLALVFTLILFLTPDLRYLFLVKLVDGTLAGGMWGYVLSRRINLSDKVRKLLLIGSIAIISFILLAFPLISVTIIEVLSIVSGVIGAFGYLSLKPWVRLGLLHLIGWSLIMPGPISLILGTPIPFYDIVGGQAILLWISAWIFGTPIAWLAGIQYLQFIRDKMTNYYLPSTHDLRLRNEGYPWLKWFVLGGIAVVSQILFFMTHSAYFLDNNGYDLIFLETMTLSSTLLMVSGLVLIGYGFYSLIKSKYNIPKINTKWFAIGSLVYAIIEMLITKMMIIAPNGYPYPPVLLLTYGEPMYAPAVTIYVPGIIGFYFYPISVLALIATSLLAGATIVLAYQSRNKKMGSLTAIGVLTACPACGLSTIGYAMTIAATASSELLSMYAQVGFTLASILILIGIFLYVVRKAGNTCSIDLNKMR